ALLPFIAEDNSRGVVSTAVIDYVSLAPLTNHDPMSRVKDIIDMIERGVLENEGAAFGALLHIGDERVCQLLIPLRDTLDHDALNEDRQMFNRLHPYCNGRILSGLARRHGWRLQRWDFR